MKRALPQIRPAVVLGLSVLHGCACGLAAMPLSVLVFTRTEGFAHASITDRAAEQLRRGPRVPGSRPPGRLRYSLDTNADLEAATCGHGRSAGG